MCMCLFFHQIYCHYSYPPQNLNKKLIPKKLIHSISQMTSLEELVLDSNDMSTDYRLSDTLSKLTNLKKLGMSQCQLSQLPDG